MLHLNLINNSYRIIINIFETTILNKRRRLDKIFVLKEFLILYLGDNKKLSATNVLF